jgi:enoyl-[acyl-carrier-protein] reductase (NADH)
MRCVRRGQRGSCGTGRGRHPRPARHGLQQRRIQIPPCDAADEPAEVFDRVDAINYAPRGIRINAVCPGTIATPMVTDMIDKGELERSEAMANQPINRLGELEEIAAAVAWLCSPGASFVVGVALPINGGYTAR